MKTLNEHNKQHMTVQPATKSGVVCDTCEIEMEYVNSDNINLSYPPSMTVQCPNCKHIGYKIV